MGYSGEKPNRKPWGRGRREKKKKKNNTRPQKTACRTGGKQWGLTRMSGTKKKKHADNRGGPLGVKNQEVGQERGKGRTEKAGKGAWVNKKNGSGSTPKEENSGN